MTEPRRSRFHTREAQPEELDEVSRVIGSSFKEYAASVPALAFEAYLKDMMDVRSRLSFTELLVAKNQRQAVGTDGGTMPILRQSEGVCLRLPKTLDIT